jgi:hypothetical protein
VTERKEFDSQRRRLVIITMTNVDKFHSTWSGGHYCGGALAIEDDVLLEDSMQRFLVIANPDYVEATRRLMRVVIGVTFFGQDRHELVLPDLPRRVIERYQREQRQPTAAEAERELQAARAQGLTGYKIGSEINLPTALHSAPGGQYGGHGQSLREGHLRRGHLRLQACGPRLQEHKVIFVAPTVVRPDLPLKTHGYRIKPDADWQPTLKE